MLVKQLSGGVNVRMRKLLADEYVAGYIKYVATRTSESNEREIVCNDRTLSRSGPLSPPVAEPNASVTANIGIWFGSNKNTQSAVSPFVEAIVPNTAGRLRELLVDGHSASKSM
jgi:hypothetical protein